MRAGKVPSGVWLCLALGLFGGGMVAVFFKAARHFTSPSAASRATFDAPAKALRLSAFNLHRALRLPDDIATVLASDDPDYVFLQEVHGKQLAEIQRELGGKLVVSTYYPLQTLPDADTDLGNAILSKYPLEDGRPVPNHMNGACGVWAVSVVDGRRFYVACLRLSESTEGEKELGNLMKAWESLGKPPTVAALGAAMAGAPSAMDAEREWWMSEHWKGVGSKVQDDVHRINVMGRATASTQQ
jgi:hypothetical protein